MKTAVVTGSADVVAYGRHARVYFITIANTGTAGTEGEVELREAQSPAGDTGTLKWVGRHAGTDSLTLHFEFAGGSDTPGIEFENGIRVVYDSITNAQVTVGYE